MKEIVKLRGETSKTYDRGNGKCRLVVGGGIQHWKKDYADKNEQWKECDLTWQGNRITKAPYDLVVQGRKVTFKDKKTGQISTIELLTSKCADPAHAGQDRTPNFEIIPFASGFRFQHRINADNLPFEAQFKVDGKLPSCNASDDDEGSLQVEVSFDEETGILTERLSEVKDADSKELRKAKGEIRIDPTITVQPPLKDTYFQAHLPANNLGAEVSLQVYDRAANPYRSLLAFPTSGIPEGSFIDAAELDLDYYLNSSPGAAPTGKVVDVCWVDRLDFEEWVEGTGTLAAPTADGATWNRFTPDLNWRTAGGEYLIGHPQYAQLATPAAFGWMTWDVIDIVSHAYDRKILANFLVKFNAETGNGNRNVLFFRSKEYAADPTRQPKLTIDYSRMVADGGSTNVTETSARINGETLADTALPAVVDYVGFVWDTKHRPNPGITWGDDFDWGFNTTPVDEPGAESGAELDWTIIAGSPSISTAARPSGRLCLSLFDGAVAPSCQTPLIAGAYSRFGYYNQRTDWARVIIYHGNGIHRIVVSNDRDGGLRYYDGAWHNIGASHLNWRHIEVRNVDWVAATYDIYDDGALVKAGADMGLSADVNGVIRFRNGSAATNAYVDGFHVVPSDDAGPAEQCLYANNWVSAAGNYNEVAFHHDLAGLDKGGVYYVRAAARINGKWYYSREFMFGTHTEYARYVGDDRINFVYGLYSPASPPIIHFEGGGVRRTIFGTQSEIYNVEMAPTQGMGSHPFVHYYDWSTGEYHGGFLAALTPIIGDPHSGCQLFVDGNHRLHVFYGAHTVTPVWWTRSTRSLTVAEPFTGVDDFETPKAINATFASYPHVVGVVNGELVILARDAIPGVAGRWTGWHRSNNFDGPWGAASFTLSHDVIDSGADNIVSYCTYKPYVDASGNIHIAWRWYNGTTTTHYNLMYAKYIAALDQWQEADGTPYVLPITPVTAEVVTADRGQHGQRIGVDETGRPYIVRDNELWVWEAPNWVMRVLPVSMPLLEVISSSLLYIYYCELDGGRYYLRRQRSTDRGVNFADVLDLGDWASANDSARLGMDTARGTLPSMIGCTVLHRTNPEEPGDAPSQYQVGHLYATTGTPSPPSPPFPPGPGPTAKLIQARIL